MEGRTRRANARRKQLRAEERWNELDKSWMKWTRCGVCRKTFCCNNYPDRKARISNRKVRGVIVCPWCHSNPEIDFIVRCIALVQNMTRVDPPKWVAKQAERKNGSYAGGPR
jgi:hypothetical protein